MGDENLENHPNWNAVLQWSLRLQDTEQDSRQLEPMDQERREFLTAALEEASALIDDPVKNMRGHLATIKNKESGREECVAALEEMSFYAEDLDQANDLYLLGGLQVCCAYLKHSDPELRSLACEVIGNAVQNNEKIVRFATESFVLSELIKMVDDDQLADSVRVKSLFALSCLVRGNRSALDKFNELEGYNVLLRAMQSNVKKLQIKALFLISNICIDFPDQCATYSSMGISHQLFSFCYVSDDAGHDVTLQHALLTLLTLSSNKHIQLPSDASLNLSELSSKLDKDRHSEQIELCSQLTRLCPSPANSVDR